MNETFDQSSSEGIERVLQSAARLISEKGAGSVTVKEVAAEAGVTAALIHSNLEAPAIFNIAERIMGFFLERAKELVFFSLRSQRNFETPIDRLVTVFQATLGAFDKYPRFGSVVLRELQTVQDDSSESVATRAALAIFQEVDKILLEARADHALAPYTDALEVSDIRKALFVLTHGLLRYKLDEKKIVILVLTYLRTFCTDSSGARIDEVVRKLCLELSSSAS